MFLSGSDMSWNFPFKNSRKEGQHGEKFALTFWLGYAASRERGYRILQTPDKHRDTRESTAMIGMQSSTWRQSFVL
jgi:hypothetical protein